MEAHASFWKVTTLKSENTAKGGENIGTNFVHSFFYSHLLRLSSLFFVGPRSSSTNLLRLRLPSEGSARTKKAKTKREKSLGEPILLSLGDKRTE